MANLSYAAIWAVVGGALLFSFYFTDSPRFHLTNSNSRILLGWLALLLAIYHVVRWWSQGARQERWPPAGDRAAGRPPANRPPEPPNPDFDFIKQPPESDRPSSAK